MIKNIHLTTIIGLFILMNSISLNVNAQQADAFKLFNENGRRISFKKMVKSLEKADVILFGELHNDPIAHYLQLKLIESLAEKSTNGLLLGAEMFEADNQKGLTDFVEGKSDYETLAKEVRLWPNHKTDYHPLVAFAKEHNLPFIATNIPRRFASMVYRGGFEVLTGLTEDEKSWIAPQPIPYDSTLPGYVKMLEMSDMGSGHSNPNFPKAQAVKDATMAFFITNNMANDRLFVHFNGSYHSDNFEGISWYLKQYKPTLNVVTITTVLEANPKKLTKENKAKAHFTIAVDEKMTRTY